MNESLFIQYVNKYWAALVTSVTERINGKKTPQRYMFKDMLTKVYSTDLKWSSLSSSNNIVAADVVAMDSSLPLKKRASITKVTGDIPKIGMKMYLNERTMSDINILAARGGMEDQLIMKIFDDTTRCLMGVNEQLELMFLQGLSSGVTVIDDDTRPGLGVRIDYGYLDSNRYGVAFNWDDPTTSTPIDDINNVLENASYAGGDTLNYIMMDRNTYNQMANSTQVRGAYAGSIGFTGANMPVVTLEQVNQLLSARFFGLQLVVIDRTIKTEENGVQTIVRPWAANQVVFTPSLNVGKLAWGTLAEKLSPNKAISYTDADDYILLKKWQSNEPFAEFTSSQALVVPVIDNVDSIYVLDTTDAQPQTGQTEGNTTITIYGDSTVLVADLVAALNDLGVAATTSNKDTTLTAKVNKLNDEQEAELKTALGI